MRERRTDTGKPAADVVKLDGVALVHAVEPPRGQPLPARLIKVLGLRKGEVLKDVD